MMSMSKPMHIAIVGAGTAGLAAAIAFRRLGHRVDVFERHGALATLGAGLLIQPQGVFALSALGVGTEFSRASVPVTLLEGKCHRGWKLVDVPYGAQEARAVSRTALGKLLFEAAINAGANVAFNADIGKVGIEERIGTICVGDRQLSFNLVIVAGGASSPL